MAAILGRVVPYQTPRARSVPFWPLPAHLSSGESSPRNILPVMGLKTSSFPAKLCKNDRLGGPGRGSSVIAPSCSVILLLRLAIFMEPEDAARPTFHCWSLMANGLPPFCTNSQSRGGGGLLCDVQGGNLGADKQRCQLRRRREPRDINHMLGTGFPGTGDVEATSGLLEACNSLLGATITRIR